MRDRFATQLPGVFFLDPTRPQELRAWLARRELLAPDEHLTSLALAGEGNMNLTLRATTSAGRSLIVKQSRPWVEKYPQLDAPPERALAEAGFYQAVSGSTAVAEPMPELVHLDAEAKIMVLQDLGQASDMADLYGQGGSFQPAELSTLLQWLSALHSLPTPSDPVFQNRNMRALNHAHIFDIPLQADNGLDLDAIIPGLAALAVLLKADGAYVSAVHALGQEYLQDGPTLLHGDFYPGSFLRTPSGLKIIDTEFCFAGRAEFDVSVFWAHYLLTGHPEGNVRQALASYSPPPGFDWGLAKAWAGVELMRRVIGYAQLPLTVDRGAILELSRSYVGAE